MIDFHAHLDLYSDPHAVVKTVTEMRMYVLSVTTTPSAWMKTNELAAKNPRIKTALGLHPQIAHDRIGELPLFDRLLPETRYVGEIGLDGSPDLAKHWDIQNQAFQHILASCTKVGGRVMSIHSRRATTPVLDYLELYPKAGIPVLHWFSGTKNELDRAIDLGCWFSVGPAMLLAKSSIELVRRMPQDRLITETDGPFAQVNKVAAMPWDVRVALRQLAGILGIESSNVEQIVHGNLRQLLERSAVTSVHEQALEVFQKR